MVLDIDRRDIDFELEGLVGTLMLAPQDSDIAVTL